MRSRRCAITEDEYRRIVLPGSIDKGQTPQRYPEQYFQYFWGVMNGKSIYSRANFQEVWGGQPLTLKEYKFRKGIKDYAWYRGVHPERPDAGEHER